jgi:hypothetical protein
MEEKEVNPPILFRVLQWIIFWVGDTRKISHFPWVTWDVHEHKIDLNEVMLEAYPLLKPGDIVLHRDDGFLSNLFIGGAMIHAGIYLGGQQLVESISEGVVKRHVAHILYSDRACILRPRLPEDKREAAVKEAIEVAEKIVGFPYDILFDFNGPRERYLVDKFGKDAIKKGVRFCCTEVPYFCYGSYTKELRIVRKRNVSVLTRLLSLLGLSPGKAIIAADMYFTANFDVIWCSRHFDVEWCKKRRVGEKMLRAVEDFWERRSAAHAPAEGVNPPELEGTAASGAQAP